MAESNMQDRPPVSETEMILDTRDDGTDRRMLWLPQYSKAAVEREFAC